MILVRVGSLFTSEEQKRIGSWRNVHIIIHDVKYAAWQRSRLSCRDFQTSIIERNTLFSALGDNDDNNYNSKVYFLSAYPAVQNAEQT